MWWEAVRASATARETPDGKTAAGICGPGVRWGHTCNAVGGGRYLYVFGGYGGDKCQTNDVHVFDTVKLTWSKPMLKGVPPSPRDSHSCTTFGSKLFVFGGTDGKNPLKDLHILDTSSNTWIAPDLQGEGPDAREGHGAVLVDKRLFIFGGCGKSETHEEKYYNDLYILDTDKLSWERAVTTGIPPSARDSHSCSSWKNKIIVIAGEDSSDCYLSDVQVLDADTLVWEPMKTAGEKLPPRAGHTTLALGSSLYVFGGFTDARSLYGDLHVLNADTGIWSRVRPLNQGPSARFSVAGDCLDERKGILVLIGGCNQTLEALDDMYYLHTDTPVGNRLYEQREKLSIRRDLREKCREVLPCEIYLEDNSSFNNKMTSNFFQADYLQELDQAGTKACDSKHGGKVTFEARVTNTNEYGYAIETIINGKLLHGMLFSCTSSFSRDGHTYPNKRMVAAVASGTESEDQPIPTTSTTIQGTVCSDQELTNGSNMKESTADIPSLETFSSSTPDTKVTCNVEHSSATPGVPGNDESFRWSKGAK